MKESECHDDVEAGRFDWQSMKDIEICTQGGSRVLETSSAEQRQRKVRAEPFEWNLLGYEIVSESTVSGGCVQHRARSLVACRLNFFEGEIPTRPRRLASPSETVGVVSVEAMIDCLQRVSSGSPHHWRRP